MSLISEAKEGPKIRIKTPKTCSCGLVHYTTARYILDKNGVWYNCSCTSTLIALKGTYELIEGETEWEE